MPLSEFLRLFRGNLDSNQQKPCSSDPSSRNENGLVELVWDNGHTRHHENVGVESILNDEMVPLLSYPMNESPPHDFCFELLPEISRDKIRSGCDQIVSNVIKIAREVEPTVEIACSSVGSENYADHIVPCEQTHNSKRKFRDLVESEYRSDDIETESVGVMKKPTTERRGSGSKRNRAAEVHNLSERRRRDRINEKMRALQQLIPNCTKADKASMLDEAIEYMKTLQLQIMSMGSGLCIPPIMFRHVHPSNVSHFPHVGVGIGIGCHFLPIHHPFQGAHFPSPGRIPGFNLPVYGNPGQVPRTPFVPQTPTTSAMGLSISNKNSKLMPNQMLDTNEMLEQSTTVQESNQATDVKGAM